MDCSSPDLVLNKKKMPFPSFNYQGEAWGLRLGAGGLLLAPPWTYRI